MLDRDGEIRLVLRRALNEAGRVGSTEIDPRHLLWGILELPGSRGAALLDELGLDIDQVRQALGFLIDIGLRLPGPPTLSALAIEALGAADAEAARAGARAAGSDDLVLALITGDSVASGILQSLGVTESSVRSAIARMRGEGPEEERLVAASLEFSVPPNVGGLDAGARPVFMSPEWADELRNRSENMDQFPEAHGDLVRVVAIGEIASAPGLDVQLTALEIRTGVMFLYWRAWSTPGRWLGGPDVAVSDPVGTRYGVIPGSGGGGEREWSGEMWIFPSVPQDVRELSIEIRKFGEPSPLFHMREDRPQGPLAGPWRFVVAI